VTIKAQHKSVRGYWQAVPTFHKKINIQNTKASEVPDLGAQLEALYRIAKNGNHDDTIKTLWSLGPGDKQEAEAMNSKSWDLKKPSIHT